MFIILLTTSFLVKSLQSTLNIALEYCLLRKLIISISSFFDEIKATGLFGLLIILLISIFVSQFNQKDKLFANTAF